VSEEINDYSKYTGYPPHPAAALDTLRENPDKINWKILSNNKSNWAIFFTAEPDKIELYELSNNKTQKPLNY
jgi:hypothetical protein